MINKRGISAIVATVLVILITVAGVGIIWVGIVPMITESIAFEGMEGRVNVVSTGGYTVYDASREVAIVQVKRDVDDGVMNRIKISFIIEGNSVSSNVVAPDSGGVKTYSFDLSGYGEPASVGVAPIFVSGSGSEKEGSVSSVKMAKGVVNLVDADVYEMERDYFYEIPMTGLVSWWKFDGDATDSVGGNDGGCGVDGVCPDYIEDSIRDKVASFNGNDYDVEVADDGSLSMVDELSISLWVYLRNYDGGYADHPFIKQTNTVDSNYILYLFGQNSGGADGLARFYANRNGAWGSISSSYLLELDQWYHLTISYDSSVGGQLYVDGNPVGTRGGIGALTVNSQDLVIGEIQDGALDDLMIFNRALSQEDVAAIYDVQKKVIS